MPAKNIIKEYEAGGYYHIYNRGVEKRNIFLDEDDYKKFIAFLRFYLVMPNLQGRTLKDENNRTISPSRANANFSDEIVLIAYCLMPNHFNILIKQVNERSMANFMHSLSTKYVMYFNKKYQRVGALFQGKYKTVHITNEEQFTYITKYIHRNPMPEHPTGSDPEGLRDYKYSSYGNYLGLFKQSWVKTEDILSYFSRTNPRNTYQAFVEETGDIASVYNEMIDLDD
jgi:putative transposase